MVHGHERAEERNLALHRLALEKLKRDPVGGKAKVLELLDRWCAMPHLKGQMPLLEKWREVLELPVDEVEAKVLGDEFQELRQASPLGALITPEERFALCRELLRT